ESGAADLCKYSDRFPLRRRKVCLELLCPAGTGFAVCAHPSQHFLFAEMAGRTLVEALREKHLVGAPETAKKRKLRQHCAISAGESRYEACPFQHVTAHGTEHVCTPASAR